MTARYDAIVVGAGPAGSAAALTLRRQGRSVLILEKDRFPRRKVCGAFVSCDGIASLERLALLDAVLAAGPETIREGSVHLRDGREVPLRLPAPALGLSRYVFDDLLARGASEAGAQIRFGARVVSVGKTRNGASVFWSDEEGSHETAARAVIGAWGRWDALDRSLDRTFLAGRRFLGWSLELTGDSRPLEGRVRLYLLRGGYCGLSRVEEGRVNLAGVTFEREWRRSGGGWPAWLGAVRRDNPALDRDLDRLEASPEGFLGTGPVFFTAKPPVERGILMVGDAAGVLDPFSGEGQAAALASGILAAETVGRALCGEVPFKSLERTYARAWRARFAGRFNWSAVFRRLMLNPGVASIAARVAGPRITSFAVSRLNASGDPENRKSQIVRSPWLPPV